MVIRYDDAFPTFWYRSTAPLRWQMARVHYREQTLPFPSLPYVEEMVLLTWQHLTALVSGLMICCRSPDV